MMNENGIKFTPLERILLSAARNNKERADVLVQALERTIKPMIDSMFKEVLENTCKNLFLSSPKCYMGNHDE